MYDPNYINWGQQGWICPQCHKTFAPHVSECPYCNSERKTFATTEVNDTEWWKKYLKQSQTGQPVNDNPSTTTATTNIDPNVKVTSWNNMETDHIKIGKDGSIVWKGPTPEIHYPSTLQEWFEVFNG